MKNKTPKSKGNFVLKFANNKRIRFRTHETLSVAYEVMSKERFANVGQMYDRVKSLPTGFEYVESVRKERDTVKRFNNIDFED